MIDRTPKDTPSPAPWGLASLPPELQTQAVIAMDNVTAAELCRAECVLWPRRGNPAMWNSLAQTNMRGVALQAPNPATFTHFFKDGTASTSITACSGSALRAAAEFAYAFAPRSPLTYQLLGALETRVLDASVALSAAIAAGPLSQTTALSSLWSALLAGHSAALDACIVIDKLQDHLSADTKLPDAFVAHLIRQGTASARCAALQALDHANNPSLVVVMLVAECFDDKDPAIRRFACMTLGGWFHQLTSTSPIGRRAYEQLVEHAKTEEDADVQRVIAWGLDKSASYSDVVGSAQMEWVCEMLAEHTLLYRLPVLLQHAHTSQGGVEASSEARTNSPI